jgi:hypothetical protein
MNGHGDMAVFLRPKIAQALSMHLVENIAKRQ